MTDIVDRLREIADLFEAQQAPHNLVLHLRTGADEIDRLRAGGCARDQGLTQYCAEAARLAVENERLRNELHIAEQWSARVYAGRDQDVAEITRLRAEREEMLAALTDLVRLIDEDDDYEADEVTPYHADKILDRARAIIAKVEEKND